MPNPLVPTTIGTYVLNLFEGRIKHIFYGNKAIESTKIDKSVRGGGGGGGETVIITRVITRAISQCKHFCYRPNKRRRYLI